MTKARGQDVVALEKSGGEALCRSMSKQSSRPLGHQVLSNAE